MLKKILITIVVIVAILFGLRAWLSGLLSSELRQDFTQSKATEIAYLVNSVPERRGKILAVVTNVSLMGTGESEKKVGYELTELARAYYVFSANGFEVDVASPQGGNAPMVRDDDDMGLYDYAFLNDDEAMKKVTKTLKMSQINSEDYEAIYFVGGKGTMFDFPDNKHIKTTIRDMWQQGKVVAAVCHGPAALIDVRLDSGDLLVKGRELASFSNEEELLLISDARTIFPYLLEDKLIEQGAQYRKGHLYLNNVVVDGRLITGQNPWSVWQVADETIKALGYTPITRQITPEEHSISILGTYADKGFDVALKQLQSLLIQPNTNISRMTITAHVFVSVLSVEFGKAFDLLRLLNASKQ